LKTTLVRAIAIIDALPWPILLVCCSGLAAACLWLIRSLPLPIFLFIGFVVVKLAVVGFVMAIRRRRRPGYRL
jgi:hypothetical protein